MINPFSESYERCNSGTNRRKYQALPDGPHIIDVEPVGLCNFRCVMCPTGLQALGRPGGFMTAETHQAILDKTQEFGTALRYIGWGEPTMHPQIVSFIKSATESRHQTHINTNGSKFTKDSTLPEELVDAGLSSIKFSFQGADRETYKIMRRIDFFEGLFDAIERMSAARGFRNSPFIAASTTTTTETPIMIDRFRERMEPLVDHLSIGKTIFEFIDMAAVPPKQRALLEEAAKDQSVEKRHPRPCPEVNDKLTIHWNGDVRVCCNDYSGSTNLGNIVTDDFRSIWRHPTIEAYRKRLANDEYSGPLCGTCYDYMDLTNDISTTVV